MRTLLTLLPLTLFACDTTTGKVPEQLETLLAEIGYSEVQDSYQGDLSVTGADQDWSLTITPAEGEPFSWTVHSPGAVDLSALSGEGRTLDLLSEEVFEERSFVISDEHGPAYVADIGANADDVAEVLGITAPTYGGAMGTEEDDNFVTTYTSLVFATDDGEVELLPGDVTTVTLGGISWRITAIAAYTREIKEGAILPGCGFLVDMLSYEMLRVETVEADESRVRPDGLSAAKVGCGY